MKKRKYLPVLLLLVASMTLGILGCTTGTTPSTTTTAVTTGVTTTAGTTTTGTTAAPKPVTLRMSWWGGDSRNKATLAALDQYMAKYNHVTLQGEYGGWDGALEKLTTQLAAGTAPDIMQIDSQWLDQFFKKIDLFVDLKKNANVDLSGFDKAFLDGISSPQGVLIGAPAGINGTALYVNKTLAMKLGIDTTKQMTWDRIVEVGKQIHTADPKVYMLNMAANQDLRAMVFEPYLLNLCGKRFIEDDYTLGFDRAMLLQTFNYIRSLYDNNIIQPVADTATLKTGALLENPKWMNNEIVYFIELLSRYAPVTKSIAGSEVIAVEFPAAKTVKNSGILVRPASMYAVSSKSVSVDESAKVISWLLNDSEAVTTLALERSIPAVEKARETLVKQGLVSENFDFAVKYALEHANLPQTFISLNQEIQKIEDDTLAKLAYSEWTPDKAADEMIRLLTDKLAELKLR